jgi:hypothetical protein
MFVRPGVEPYACMHEMLSHTLSVSFYLSLDSVKLLFFLFVAG